jgi:RND family efflux transporter MFP subunit
LRNLDAQPAILAAAMKRGMIFAVIGLLAVVGLGSVAMQRMGAAKASAKGPSDAYTVSRQDLAVKVIETGTVEASRSVEVKARVSGRLARLLVDEGDVVTQGQLIAIIDPQETELRVRQDQAQLKGARSGVERTRLEIEQRKKTNEAAYRQAETRLEQLRMESNVQPTLTQASIVAARTALETARSERQRLVTSQHPTQKVNADREVAEAQAGFDNAEVEYRRNADLEQRGFVSGREVENAKLALDLAKVRLSSAKENRDRLMAQFRTEISKAGDQIRQAETDLTRARANAIQTDLKRKEVASAEAELARAQAALMDAQVLEKQLIQSQAGVEQLESVLSDSQRQLGETDVRAPISGIVTKRLLEVGELASGLSGFSSGTPILRIEDRSSMRVKLDINEIDTAKLRIGMIAQIDVDAIPTRSYTGRLMKIAPSSKLIGQGQAQAADAVVRYEVEIALTDADVQLRSGMSSKCTIEVTRRDDVVTIPVEYVVREGRKAFVELPLPKDAKPDAKPERKEIQLGETTGATIEVRSGLNAGDQIKRPAFRGPQRQGMVQMGGGGDEE